MTAGTLYIVPLPIGNIEDITLRALKVLQSVDIVAAEDTRTFKELASLMKLQVRRVIAYHDHNEDDSASGLIKLLLEGQTIALVSDAGTPGIADPGYSILNKAFKNNVRIEPLPGASSLTTALSACPIGGASHTFYGFAPTKSKERREQFSCLHKTGTRSVFFESPHRVVEHLQDAYDMLGNIAIFIAREISKTYQEYLSNDLETLLSHFKKTTPKGEFVIVYPEIITTMLSSSGVIEIIKDQLSKGRSSKDILDILKNQTDLSRTEIYDLIQKIKKDAKKV